MSSLTGITPRSGAACTAEPTVRLNVVGFRSSTGRSQPVSRRRPSPSSGAVARFTRAAAASLSGHGLGLARGIAGSAGARSGACRARPLLQAGKSAQTGALLPHGGRDRSLRVARLRGRSPRRRARSLERLGPPRGRAATAVAAADRSRGVGRRVGLMRAAARSTVALGGLEDRRELPRSADRARERLPPRRSRRLAQEGAGARHLTPGVDKDALFAVCRKLHDTGCTRPVAENT